MQPNNNLSCIPFYKSLEEQDYRKWYAYGDKYPHSVPSDFLIPFHFVFPKDSESESCNIEYVEFYRVCCEEEEPIDSTGAMQANGLVANGTNPDYHEIIYYASPNTNLGLPRGFYYMLISLAMDERGEAFYSDVFYVGDRETLEANSIKVEWWNEENLDYDGGRIPYGERAFGSALYKSELFLDTEIGKPEYNFTEEGEERNGHFFPTKQISEKSYNFGFIAPEYLCDVMRLIRMADAVRITDKLGRVYDVEQFEMDVNWTEQGHYAEVGCTFQTDTIVKKVGKAYNNISDR